MKPAGARHLPPPGRGNRGHRRHRLHPTGRVATGARVPRPSNHAGGGIPHSSILVDRGSRLGGDGLHRPRTAARARGVPRHSSRPPKRCISLHARIPPAAFRSKRGAAIRGGQFRPQRGGPSPAAISRPASVRAVECSAGGQRNRVRDDRVVGALRRRRPAGSVGPRGSWRKPRQWSPTRH